MSSHTSEPLDFLRSDQIVRAGAGTGKTYTLAHQALKIARRLYAEDQVPRVVLTTFTRKAANELRERVIVYALESGEPNLIRFVRSQSQLQVGTLHSLSDKFLRRYGAALGLDSGFDIMNKADSQKFAGQILRELILEHPPFQALLAKMTFTDLLTRVQIIVRAQVKDPALRPYSQAEIDEAYASHLDELISRGFKLRSALGSVESPEFKKLEGELALFLSDIDRLKQDQISEWSQRLSLPRKGAQAAPEALKSDFRTWKDDIFDFLSNPSHQPSVRSQYGPWFDLVQKVVTLFVSKSNSEKIRLGKLDIEDLESFSLELSRSKADPNLPSEAALAFASEFDYWLVDEFQDTNPIQVALIRFWSWGRPQFLVGDPQQSIYLFRDARSEVFAEREQQISQNGGISKLLVNRRSTEEVLSFVNRVFQPFSQFEAMQPMPRPKDASEPSINDGAVEIYLDQQDEKSEVRAIADKIASWKQSGAQLSEIAVLGRTHQGLMMIADELHKNGIAHSVQSGAGFYQRLEIIELIAFYRFLLLPFDTLHLLILVRSPWFRISDQLIHEIQKLQPRSFWEGLLEEQRVEQVKCKLKNYLNISKTRGILTALRRFVIDEGFILGHHTADSSGRREANIFKFIALLSREHRVSGFSANAFASNRYLFGNALGVDDIADASPARNQEFVRLMTIHASKGLEFERVILPFIHKGITAQYNSPVVVEENTSRWSMRLQLSGAKSSDAMLLAHKATQWWYRQQLTEAERLFYVALTRARRVLFLSGSLKKRMQPGSFIDILKHLETAPGQHESAGGFTYNVHCETIAEGGDPSVNFDLREAPQAPSALDISVGSPVFLSVTDWLSQNQSRERVPAHVFEPQMSQSGDFKTGPIHLADLAMRADLGIRVHKLLEIFKFPSSQLIESIVNHWFADEAEEVLRALQFVRVSEDLATVLTSGEVEWGFTFAEGQTVIEGQIDMFGRDQSGRMWVVDYKTGAVSGRERAFRQMEAYAYALLKFNKIQASEEVVLAAVFPFAGQIEKKFFLPSTFRLN